MSDLINPGNFDFFARFLLSGLIIIWIRSHFVIGERPRLTEMIIEAVIFSLFNQLIFLLLGWGLALVALSPTVSPKTALFAEVLALPIFLGLVLGWVLSSGKIDALFRLLSIPTQDLRRAYDFAFALDQTERFVIVTYEDGTMVQGYFGENSLAASDSGRSDLYLESLYDVGEDGLWYEKSPARSALLSLNGVRSIEFLEPKGKAK